VVSITPRPRFTPGERTPGTHCTGGWVGPRAGLDAEGRGKILCLCRGSNSNPVRSQTLFELAAALAPCTIKGRAFLEQLRDLTSQEKHGLMDLGVSRIQQQLEVKCQCIPWRFCRFRLWPLDGTMSLQLVWTWKL
jgi:hypothetical protein